MHNFETPADRNARANLQARRYRELERQQRIFNDKLRTIGVDRIALDMQVMDKKLREEETKKEENANDSEMVHNSKAAIIIHHKQEKERRGLEKSLVTFRHLHQQPCQGRDFDLNDPERYRKMRESEAQMILPGLVGEDLRSKGRQQKQKEQLRDWLTQQQADHEAARYQEMLEEQRYNKERVEMDNLVMQHQMVEMERRKAEAMATDDFNLAKLEEKLKRQEGEQHDTGANMLWIPSLCCSNERGPYSESQRELTHFQKCQVEEKRMTELEKKLQDEVHDRFRLSSARTALLLERRQARLNRQQRQHLDNTNAQLAETQKREQPDIERGHIDNSFFSQFNTCSR